MRFYPTNLRKTSTVIRTFYKTFLYPVTIKKAKYGGSRVNKNQNSFDNNLDEANITWHDLFEMAIELKKLKPWEYLENHHVIVVEHPVTEEMLYICVMGAGGQEFGLAIYIGDYGRKILEQIELDTLPPDYYYDMHCLNVTFVDREEITKEDYQLIKSQGLSFRGKKNWVQFRSYLPGKFPWIPDEAECDLILFAMLQTMEVVHQIKEGWEFPELPFGDYYFRQLEFVDGKAQISEQIIGFVEEESKEEVDPIIINISEFELKQLAKKKVEREEIEFDLMYMPHAVKEEPDDRPFYPLLVIALSRSTGMVIHQEMVPLGKDRFIAQATFKEMIKILPFKPSTIYVSQEIYKSVASLANAMEVQLKEDQLFALKEFKQYLEQMS